MPSIGVSIAVPEPWGSALQQYRIDVGDDAAAHIPTHITLLPPQEVPEDAISGIVGHLNGVATGTDTFRVHLRGTGTFAPVSPVVFVGVVEGISRCERLAASVCQGPLEIQRTYPYHPHVTVAHHLPEHVLRRAFEDLQDFDASFDAEEMWMYLHHETSGWQPTHAFAFGGSTACGRPGDQ